MSNGMSERVIVFSHGKDSEPWGSKIVAMAERARSLGWRAESVDYRGIDDPLARVNALLDVGRSLNVAPVLVGSSLGGHVSTAASIELKARGLFLLAPAFYMPGYEQYTPQPMSCPITILHGWHDDIVPVDNSIRYAREHQATLTVMNTDHRMLDRIPAIVHALDGFLRQFN